MLEKILLIMAATLFISGGANANITGAHSISDFANGSYNQCPPNSSGDNAFSYPVTEYIIPGRCTLSSNNYVPVSGYYTVVMIVYLSDGQKPSYSTNPVYIDGMKSINEQQIMATGGASGTVSIPGEGSIFTCYYLVDSNQQYYFITGDGVHYYGACSTGYTPLPPTPPTPTTSCIINDGSALSVSLGTLNRDEIPTVPDSGSAISKTISVVCTGGTVTANMQLNYTPISVGSNQAVKTSANGVGAAIFYSNKVLAPADVTPVNFLEGSNTLTLGFQAVRDSTVALKDIPTGAFTANAVLVMTQQ